MFDIKIINSFNKKDNSQNKEDTFNDASTLNSNKIESASTNIGSFTNDKELNNIIIPEVCDKKNNSFIRDIIVGAIDSVLGAVIAYYILSVIELTRLPSFL